MQKRILLTLISIVSILGGASCSKKAPDITYLTFGKLFDAEASIDANFETISVPELRSMIEKKYNFALVVYDKDSTCTCYTTFKETIRKYMKTTNCLFYAVDYFELEKSGDTFGLKLSTGNETVAVFRDGVVKAQKNTSDSNDKFTSDITTFTTWMDNNAHISSMLYISEKQMNALFSGNEGFTLGFLRKSCSDCSYLSGHLLKDFNVKKANHSYVIECDQPGIRLDDDGKFNQDNWDAFKNKMGLAEAANPEYGYGMGYVPSFVRYNPDTTNEGDYASCIFDSCVYANDKIENVGGKYTVTESFYTEDRLSNVAYLEGSDVENKVLKGLEVNEEDLVITSEDIIWKNESASKYHDPLLKSFLDFYVSMSKN